MQETFLSGTAARQCKSINNRFDQTFPNELKSYVITDYKLNKTVVYNISSWTNAL